MCLSLIYSITHILYMTVVCIYTLSISLAIAMYMAGVNKFISSCYEPRTLLQSNTLANGIAWIVCRIEHAIQCLTNVIETCNKKYVHYLTMYCLYMLLIYAQRYIDTHYLLLITNQTFVVVAIMALQMSYPCWNGVDIKYIKRLKMSTQRLSKFDLLIKTFNEINKKERIINNEKKSFINQHMLMYTSCPMRL